MNHLLWTPIKTEYPLVVHLLGAVVLLLLLLALSGRIWEVSTYTRFVPVCLPETGPLYFGAKHSKLQGGLERNTRSCLVDLEGMATPILSIARIILSPTTGVPSLPLSFLLYLKRSEFRLGASLVTLLGCRVNSTGLCLREGITATTLERYLNLRSMCLI